MQTSPAATNDGIAAQSREIARRGSAALDQCRGLALVFVLISHGFLFTDRVHGIGRVGVNLFFFISGILVFRSLARSRANSDWQRTRSFWWRRLRRLYPALLAYVPVLLVASWILSLFPATAPVADLRAYVKNVPLALAYLVDYKPDDLPPSLAHLWSLGCEMQFYLLAPLLWIFGGQREPRMFLVFASVLGVLVLLGMAQPFLGIGKYHFEFAVWPMMAGFCCEYRRAWFQKIPLWLVETTLWLSSVAGGGSLLAMLFGFELKVVVIAVGALLLLPCFLAYNFGRMVPGPAGRALEWLGVRTYSIYLWQQPFTICYFLPTNLHPLGALVSVGVGALWFRWFEFPFLSTGRQKDEGARELA